jgi:uncharacterized protein (DUF1778 family)
MEKGEDMAAKHTPHPAKGARSNRPLMVRLDEESRGYLARAAELRRISVSDYIRVVAVTQARREVESASEQVIALAPEEQLAFWNALNQPARSTQAQRQLGALMRAESE